MSEPVTDAELIAYALEMRANVIETGDPNLSRTDVADRASAQARSFNSFGTERNRVQLALRRIAALTPEQLALVSRCRALAWDYRTGKLPR